MDNVQWLNDEIRSGLAKLLCLRLDSTPAEDMVEGTAQAWLTALTHGRVWDQGRDTARVRGAFDTLLATCERWPIPRQLMEALPPPTAQARLEKPEPDPAVAQAALDNIRALLNCAPIITVTEGQAVGIYGDPELAPARAFCDEEPQP